MLRCPCCYSAETCWWSDSYRPVSQGCRRTVGFFRCKIKCLRSWTLIFVFKNVASADANVCMCQIPMKISYFWLPAENRYSCLRTQLQPDGNPLCGRRKLLLFCLQYVQVAVHGLCTPSTRALYCEYMALVLRVQERCTASCCDRWLWCEDLPAATDVGDVVLLPHVRAW